mgnify:CR=1 FL=1
MAWWAISSDDLLAALNRVAEGEAPMAVYMDLYTQSVVESAGLEPLDTGDQSHEKHGG